MSQQPGTSLGSYRIVARLGAGGMGEVYRARDTRLDREVAIKVLLDEVAADADRLQRFEREAKVLAALNHPNIATLYGFEGTDTPFLVMELVEGPTLAELIATGPIPVAEAIPIFSQIADGLEAAHEQGIVHRDLKPANVKVGQDSSDRPVVKILDFGLAKALAPTELSADPDPGATQSPTLTLAATMRGEILGTAAYMSPEQASGKMVDRRTDIWAFGACLYEALTGRRVFQADDVANTLAAVLRDDVDWDRLPAATPPALRRLLTRCLERDRRRRLQHIGDARLELEEASRPAEGELGPADVRAGKIREVLQTAAIAAAAALVAAGLVWYLRTQPATLRVERFGLASVAEPVYVATNSEDVAISPDGTRVIYKTGGPQGTLSVRNLERLATTRLADGVVWGPVVSPDGRWVAFNDLATSTIEKVSILGGPSVEICPVEAGSVRGISWGEDGSIVFGVSLRGGLWRVSAAGGEPEALTTPQSDLESHAWPEILPGGRGVLFTVLRPDSANAQIALLDLETGEHRVLLPNGFHPHYSSSGHVIYAAAGALWAVAFDADRMRVTGDPVQVLDGVVLKASGAASFDVADNGSLVYVRGDPRGGGRRRLVWVNREGHEEAVGGAPTRSYIAPRLSPDGSRVALQVLDLEFDVVIWDFARQTLDRLTWDAGADWNPVWTPDGGSIIFSSNREGAIKLYRRSADGGGEAEKLNDLAPSFAGSVSPDGRLVVFTGSVGLGTLPLDGSEVETLLLDDATASQARVSPNGRWLAYQSKVSGTDEIYLRPFPDVDNGRWIVSTAGGTDPVWSRDGSELFYRTSTDLMRVTIDSGETLLKGAPEVLFPARIRSTNSAYDVSLDGQRFLMIRESDVENAVTPELILVKNWTEELKRLVPEG